MAQHTQRTKFFVALPYATAKLEKTPNFQVFTSDMSEYGYPTVAEIEVDITFDLPSHEEMVLRQVAELRKRQTKERAEAEKKDQEFEEQIAKLLALTYTATTIDEPGNEPWRATATTIITGCGLIFRETSYWGDLWLDADGTSIFNGIPATTGGAVECIFPEDEKFIEVPRDHEDSVTQKGHVFFIPPGMGDLSPAAQNYLAAAPRL